MFSGQPVYCTREDVKGALDSMNTAYNDVQVDRLVQGATQSIEGQMQRYFYPRIDTKYWEWPNWQMGRSWRLWLDKWELISFTQVVTGGITVQPTEFFLEPQQSGPPYSHIEFKLTSSFAFGGGSTPQRDVAITGVFGYTNNTTAAGQLTAAITSTSATSCTVSDSSLIGTGDTILLGTEYCQVTARSYTDSTQSINGNLTATQSNTLVPVVTPGGFNRGESILVDGEYMLINDIAGNNLVVRRAWNGSALAAHTLGAEIYVPRQLTLIRATLGTTAATYSNGQAVLRHAPPELIRQLCIAECIYSMQQEQGAYASIVQRARDLGATNARIATSSMFHPIDELRQNALTQYGRKVRLRAV